MKRTFALVAASLALVACNYDDPLGAVKDVKAPREVAGRWQLPVDPAEPGRKHAVNLVIHPTADQRLLVDYEFEPGKRWYFSGYPVMEKHPDLMEFEFAGDSEGRQSEEKRYLLVQWKRDGDSLEWGIVDDAKLRKGGKDGAELRKALQAALADGKLPVGEKKRFTRVVPKES